MRLFEYLLETAAGPELHDKLLTGAETWDRPEVVTAFTNFKKWQDKKWIPDGALGLDPDDVEPWYVQGKAAYTITGSVDRVRSDPGREQEVVRLRRLPVPDRPEHGPALRLRRGLHDERASPAAPTWPPP